MQKTQSKRSLNFSDTCLRAGLLLGGLAFLNEIVFNKKANPPNSRQGQGQNKGTIQHLQLNYVSTTKILGPISYVL